MAVVKLKNGELWVHSPIDLDEETKKEIDALGEVKHIVSPNYEHLKYAKMGSERIQTQRCGDVLG